MHSHISERPAPSGARLDIFARPADSTGTLRKRIEAAVCPGPAKPFLMYLSSENSLTDQMTQTHHDVAQLDHLEQGMALPEVVNPCSMPNCQSLLCRAKCLFFNHHVHHMFIFVEWRGAKRTLTRNRPCALKSSRIRPCRKCSPSILVAASYRDVASLRFTHDVSEPDEDTLHIQLDGTQTYESYGFENLSKILVSDGRIRVWVEHDHDDGRDGGEMRGFHISRSDAFAEWFLAYATEVSADVTVLQFFYEGQQLDGTQPYGHTTG